MFNLKLFVPVLALAAMALPAGATVATYCDGGGCGSNTTAAFNTVITSTPYTYQYTSDQDFVGSLTDSNMLYTDSTTGMTFFDPNGFQITGGTLVTNGQHDSITITVPEAFSALQLSVSETASGFFFTYLDPTSSNYTNLSQTPIYLGYTTDTTGASWTVQITAVSPENIVIDGFNPAGATQNTGGGPTGGDTPEVATFILIGFGLLAMRWMRRAQQRFFRSPQPVC